MAIKSDEELRFAVAKAGDLLQDIQKYCGRTLRDDSKIKFPRGVIGTADSYRARCPGYLEVDTISNCAYAFMHLDVLWWLVSRTDIVGVGKQMVIKSAIVTLATILEATLHIPGLPRNRVLSSKCSAGVNPRVEMAVDHKWICADDGVALKKLWENRNNVHVVILSESERDLYKAEDINAPHAALLKLMSKLKGLHDEGQLLSLLTG